MLLFFVFEFWVVVFVLESVVSCWAEFVLFVLLTLPVFVFGMPLYLLWVV